LNDIEVEMKAMIAQIGIPMIRDSVTCRVMEFQFVPSGILRNFGLQTERVKKSMITVSKVKRMNNKVKFRAHSSTNRRSSIPPQIILDRIKNPMINDKVNSMLKIPFRGIFPLRCPSSSLAV
jgi:hypothetical protein